MNRLPHVVIALLLTTIAILHIAPVCDAGSKTLKQECETKAQKAAELINKIGPEAAFKEITNPDGPFVGKKSHVFCFNSESGTLLAHKVTRFVGVNMNHYLDADKNTPYVEILKKSKTEPSGWMTYSSRGSGPDRRETPGLKNMYFHKVSGKKMILCCGYWEE